MSDETQVEVLEERQVDFYGDTILAILIHMGGQTLIVVPVRPVCEVLGLSWTGQRQRIIRDEVLKSVVCEIHTTGRDGKRYKMIALPLEYLHGWLFGITTSQVKEEYRNRITLYRRECFRVLSAAFQSQLLPPTEPTPEGANVQELQRIVEMGEAIVQMARQQIALQQQQAHLTRRLDKAKHVVKGIQDDVAGVQQEVADIQIRLGSVEEHLHPHAYISDEQATTISNAVKALAASLSETESGKNHYQGIFSELYRRFSVSSYKLIRQEQYTEVLAFLEEWRADQAQ